MTSKLLRSTVLLSCLLLLSSCALFKKKGGDAGGYGGGSDSDTVGGTPLPERQDGVSFMGDNVDKTKFPPVHFAFDSYAIDPADQGTLDSVAAFLQSAPNTVIIAGFTDERGTPEYNRGLGESRAEAVRDYLLHKGADNGKIQTVSFGAEMPVDPDSNEDAWAKNRRAEFGVVK
jgi:peptidoglycan-associated lipoprotein